MDKELKALQRGRELEALALEVISTEKVVRENEIAALLTISETMARRIARRLEEKGYITRTRGVSSAYDEKERPRQGMAGTFLRLTARGASKVPDGESSETRPTPRRWEHRAMSILSLCYINQELFGGLGKVISEAEMLSEIRKGSINHNRKYPDGYVSGVPERLYFEQESSRKSGPHLQHMINAMVNRARAGDLVIVSVPYPPSSCYNIDHQVRITNSFRIQWGEFAECPNVKFLLVHFKNQDDYENVRPEKFEFVEMGRAKKTPNTQAQIEKRLTIQGQVNGYHRGPDRIIKPTNFEHWQVRVCELLCWVTDAKTGERKEVVSATQIFVYDGEYGYAIISILESPGIDMLINEIAYNPPGIFQHNPTVSSSSVSFGQFVNDQKRKNEVMLIAWEREATASL